MTVTAPAVAASGVAVANPTGQWVNVTVTGGTVSGIYASNPAIAAVTTPSVPASPATIANPNSFYVLATVTGGTVTVISVGGTTIYTATANAVVVPPGVNLGLTYSVLPTLAWSPLWAGVSGNPVASPSTISVAPGGSITLIYSAAPTWAWSNPLDEGYAPGYYANNAQASAPGWNPYTALPYAQHAQLGVTGLATGVSN